MTRRTRHWLLAAAAVPITTVQITTVLAAGCAATGASPARHVASAAVAAEDSARGGRPAGTSRARCAPSQLRLAIGPRASEATEQHTLILLLRNISAHGCTLEGYPAITLTSGSGAVLPFAYHHRGDQMLTGDPPAPVRLAPGATAYAGLNKNACVTFSSASARRIQLTPPGSSQSLSVTLPPYPSLDYCGPADPGHAVDVIPVQPRMSDVFFELKG
jgi:hypothetical protein